MGPSTNGTDSPAPRRRRLSSGALQRLEIAVGLTDLANPAANIDLRDAVREQVTHLRALGEPPSHVITEIKREVADALARTGALRGDEPATRAVIDQVVRWATDPPTRGD
jgi:hypothetical protein